MSGVLLGQLQITELACSAHSKHLSTASSGVEEEDSVRRVCKSPRFSGTAAGCPSTIYTPMKCMLGK